jgi:hypothetical protein
MVCSLLDVLPTRNWLAVPMGYSHCDVTFLLVDFWGMFSLTTLCIFDLKAAIHCVHNAPGFLSLLSLLLGAHLPDRFT